MWFALAFRASIVGEIWSQCAENPVPRPPQVFQRTFKVEAQLANYSGLPTPTLETPTAQTWYGSNNRISTWGYDGAGNITQVASMQRAFSYDAESRQATATINGQTTSYGYDGDGRR